MSWWKRLLRRLFGEDKVAPSPEPAMPTWTEQKEQKEERKLWLENVIG